MCGAVGALEEEEDVVGAGALGGASENPRGIGGRAPVEFGKHCTAKTRDGSTDRGDGRRDRFEIRLREWLGRVVVVVR